MTDAARFKTLLKEQYYAPVPIDISRKELEDAAGAYLRYLRLPREVKRSMHYKTNRERETPDGYNEKTAEESKDPKEFFHWLPRIKKIPDYQEKYATIPEVKEFGDIAEDLFLKVTKRFGELHDEVFPEQKHFLFDKEGNVPTSVLRFLSYRPKSGDAFCAKAHYDKGFSTLALAESAPGLRIGCCNKHPLHSVRHEEGTALFMPAWMLYEATDHTVLPAWHDVIHSEAEHDVNDICARWSIVFFGNSPTIDFGARDEVHTPLH
jgi:hypothetical protein